MTDITPEPRKRRGVIEEPPPFVGKKMEFDFNGLHYTLTEVDPSTDKGWSAPDIITVIRVEKAGDPQNRTRGWVEARTKGDKNGYGTTVTVKMI